MKEKAFLIAAVSLIVLCTTITSVMAEVQTGTFTVFSHEGKKAGVMFESEDGQTAYSIPLRNLEKAIVVRKDHTIEEYTDPREFIRKMPKGRIRLVISSNVIVVVE